jgi:chromosome segregation ATPase
MARMKSPVDDLVDGLDAIGSILDENLPLIKARLSDINEQQAANTGDINEIRRSVKAADEANAELTKAVTNLDIRIEEILATIGALGRRLDQLQKSMLDLMESIDQRGTDTELADAVKSLEDRLKRLEGGTNRLRDFPGQF